jgi:hypothetical protein
MDDDDDTEKLSKTVMFDAYESGLDPNDPEVRELARKAQLRKQKRLTYRIWRRIEKNLPEWVVSAMLAIVLGLWTYIKG